MDSNGVITLDAMMWVTNYPFHGTDSYISVNKGRNNQLAMTNFDQGPLCRAKNIALSLGICLMSPSGHDFHTAWKIMIKSYIRRQYLEGLTWAV